MNHELVHKYRPKTFKDVLGQEHVTKTLLDLTKKRKLPHYILLSGPSGCGKTTIARIIADKLGCHKDDYHEMDAATNRGIDEIRDKILKRKTQATLSGGKSRIWYLDEAHQLTSQAQHSLLKVLEEPPAHVYFILATTHPGKLIPTVRNRAMQFALTLVKDKDIEALLTKVIEAEGLDIPETVTDKIIRVAKGSPRASLHLLEKAAGASDEEDMLNCVESSDAEKQAYDLCKLLIWNWNPRLQWKDVAAILKKLEEPEETIRHLVLANANTAILQGGKFSKRAYLVIQAFRDHFYDCGRAGLSAACYECCNSR